MTEIILRYGIAFEEVPAVNDASGEVGVGGADTAVDHGDGHLGSIRWQLRPSFRRADGRQRPLFRITRIINGGNLIQRRDKIVWLALFHNR